MSYLDLTTEVKFPENDQQDLYGLPENIIEILNSVLLS